MVIEALVSGLISPASSSQGCGGGAPARPVEDEVIKTAVFESCCENRVVKIVLLSAIYNYKVSQSNE